MIWSGNSHGVMAKVLDCDIVVRMFEHQSHYYIHCQINTPGKGMKDNNTQQWVKYYCHSSASNNPRRLICHYKKKANETKQLDGLKYS